MREEALRFGDRGSLAGVITDPPGESLADARGVGAIILNAGLVHRVGPNRLAVSLARRLASSGFPTLRFDYSNVGDSEPRADGLGVDASALDETRQAMDTLAVSRQRRSFVLIGICSGAVNAFRVACEDTRVAGVVPIDGYAYRTPRYYLRHYGPRLISGTTWSNIIGGRNRLGRWLHSWIDLGGAGSVDGDDGQFLRLGRRYPPKRETLANLNALIDRGVKLLVIYTAGGMSDRYNYASQFYDSFPALRSSDGIRVEFLEAADHLISRLYYQRFLIDTVNDWMVGAFARAVPTPREAAPAGASSGPA